MAKKIKWSIKKVDNFYHVYQGRKCRAVCYTYRDAVTKRSVLEGLYAASLASR